MVPWKVLLKIVEPHYPVAGRGRRPYSLDSMLRVHLMQNWFALSDPAMEEALYEIASLRSFARLSLEHPFRVIKHQFGLVKVRFRGLAKNTAHVTLFALSNLRMTRKQLMTMTGVVRPNAA